MVIPHKLCSKFLFGFLAIFLALTPFSARAQDTPGPSIQVYIDGTQLPLDVAPVVEQGRTLVPLRAIFEALGTTVEWNAAEQTINAVRGDTTLKLTIGSNVALRNGIRVTLDVPPRVINNRTLVPLRFIGESLGAQVVWDQIANSVRITSPIQFLTPQQLSALGQNYMAQGNSAEAAKYLRLAAVKGDQEAQFLIFTIMGDDMGVGDNLKVAEQGDAVAQDYLGELYLFGYHEQVQQDYAAALKWFRKAAEQGYAPAQNNLGWMYDNGLGIKQDYAEAFKWYQKAADQGYAPAQANLAYMYYMGMGINQNYTEAAKWYRRAANQGFAIAETGLGSIYYFGLGMPKDEAEGLKWLKKAAEQGNPDAIEILKKIGL